MQGSPAASSAIGDAAKFHWALVKNRAKVEAAIERAMAITPDEFYEGYECDLLQTMDLAHDCPSCGSPASQVCRTNEKSLTLKHVIESLDSALFKRVTGLSVADFKMLSDLGLFNAQHMNHAIYQFKRFESSSLDYALTDEERERRHQHEQTGLWDTVTSGKAM